MCMHSCTSCNTGCLLDQAAQERVTRPGEGIESDLVSAHIIIAVQKAEFTIKHPLIVFKQSGVLFFKSNHKLFKVNSASCCGNDTLFAIEAILDSKFVLEFLRVSCITFLGLRCKVCTNIISVNHVFTED